MPSRPRAALLLALSLTVLAATGTACSGGGEGGTSAPEVIEVTFTGDSVSPSGERIDVSAGQPLTFEVTAEKAGEIHVHSDPEQTLEYDAGETTLELTLDRPGVVNVESHELDQVIVSVAVR